jgi:peptidoglycan-associated lipoprotein
MLKRYANVTVLTILVLGLALSAGGCKPKPVDEPQDAQAAQPADDPPIPGADQQADTEPDVVEVDPGTDFDPEIVVVEEIVDDRTARDINESGELKTVYFDYDKAELGDNTRMVLRSNAEWLRDNDRWNVVVQGHCDERGTIEYNLALGQRRANSVREYLASLGVTPSRVRIVSYGEEKPAVAGSNEVAFQQNRRAEFVVE